MKDVGEGTETTCPHRSLSRIATPFINSAIESTLAPTAFILRRTGDTASCSGSASLAVHAAAVGLHVAHLGMKKATRTQDVTAARTTPTLCGLPARQPTQFTTSKPWIGHNRPANAPRRPLRNPLLVFKQPTTSNQLSVSPFSAEA